MVGARLRALVARILVASMLVVLRGSLLRIGRGCRTVAALRIAGRLLTLRTLTACLLRLPGMLLEPIGHRLAIGTRVGKLWIALQGAIVGRDRLLVLAGLRQGVAKVVSGTRRVALREILFRARVIVRAIRRHALQLRIACKFSGLRIIATMQCLRRALIGPCPQR